MKVPTFRLVLGLLAACPVWAWCTEVVFVPGWHSGYFGTASYARQLKQIYPEANIKILLWKSTSLRWDDAKANAAAFVPEVVGYIAAKPAGEQTGIILIGHSLGARIVTEAAKQLAKKRIRIRQFILLGAAVDCDDDFESIPAASTNTNFNIFSRSDNVLKLAYGNVEGKFAAGFCGIDAVPGKRFEQYEVATLGNNAKLPGSATEAYEQLRKHESENYLLELSAIRTGRRKAWKPKYDYSGIKFGKYSIPKGWAIPPFGDITVIDSYAEWSLMKTDVTYTTWKGEKKTRTGYLIVDHCGRVVMGSPYEFPLRQFFEMIKKRIRPL